LLWPDEKNGVKKRIQNLGKNAKKVIFLLVTEISTEITNTGSARIYTDPY